MKKISFRKYLVMGVTILFIGASIVPTLAQPLDKYYATADIPVLSSEVINDYTYTDDSDDQYEAITEAYMGKGKPINRYWVLEHKWIIDVSEEYDCYSFYIEAYHTPNAHPEHFVFAYSLDNETFTDMLTVTKTADDDMCQKSSPLPDTLSGTVYIRVRDTVRSHEAPWNDDTIFIDHMYIAADTTPPVISDVMATDNDNSWINRSAATEPGETFLGRQEFGMAYDSLHDKIIVVGGVPRDGPHLKDTWAYDYTSNTWDNRSPTEINGVLRPIVFPELVYDAHVDRTILFGGRWYDGGYNYNAETWAYDYVNDRWENMTPSVTYEGGTLNKGYGHLMTYDPDAERIILFGGNDREKKRAINETWEYDYLNNTWTNLTPDITISGGILHPRYLGGLTYDPVADRSILFGGYNYSYSYFNDTWEFNYAEKTWTKIQTNTVGGALTQRFGHDMDYDASINKIVLFGGRVNEEIDYVNETWEFSYADSEWRLINTSSYNGWLLNRYFHEIEYNDIAECTILIGGWHGHREGSDYIVIFDTTTWAYNSSDNSAIITWVTDEPSTSKVNYGETTDLGTIVEDSDLVLFHKIVLIGLDADTQYFYEVASADESGNEAVDNNEVSYYSFTTGLAPQIININVHTITHSSAIIEWTTHEPSSSIVYYGENTPNENISQNNDMVIDHSILITDLNPQTMYVYQVKSTDISGKSTTSIQDDYTTDAAPSTTMHIHSVDMWYTQNGKKSKIFTEVMIVDFNGDPVEGAIVTIESYSISSMNMYDTQSGLIGSDGIITFMYGPTKSKGEKLSIVTNVVKNGWIYDPNDNVEDRATVYVY